MTYEQSIKYIHSIPKFIRPLGNSALGELLSQLGNPQKNLKFIHIAGTNGKGSTASMIAQVLICAKYKTCLYTSPYIERFNERIKINGECISDFDLADITTRIVNCMQKNNISISEFAFDTAMMFLYAYEQNCDFVVLETGLGGKLDATNIIDSNEVCVITSISLDHTQLLGETLSEIATEKSGIIKERNTVILYPIQEAEVFDVFENACKKSSSKLIVPKIPTGDTSYLFECCDKTTYESKLSLQGEFQKYNACVAVEAINELIKKGAKITADDISKGLSQTFFPARFERIGSRIILDGAHNPDGIKTLCRTLGDEKYTIIIAMMSDKSVSECVSLISKVADNVITTQIDMPRCMSSKELASVFHGVNVTSFDTVRESIDYALSLDKTICICGSLYLAGEARRLLH